jgi:hypothetical protein
MKAWKLVIAIALALIAVALITASVFAYMGGPGFYSPYGTNVNGAYGAYPGGMMGGMMGWLRGTPSTVMSLTTDQAKAYAQQYLNASLLGTTVGDVTTFYGYYHIDMLLSGNTYGMLSVNGYTGQVWYHTWHGTFVQQVEL